MTRLLALAVAALTAGVFALDALTPVGLGVWMLYLVPLGLSARLPYRYAPAAVAAAAVPLLAADRWVSPPGPAPGWAAAINWAGRAAVVAAAAGLLVAHKRREGDRGRLVTDLRAGESRYRVLFDANPLPMWVYDPATLRFLAVNDAAVARYGYSRAEFLGMTIADIRPPEDVGRVRAAAAEAAGGLRRTGGWRHVTKAGDVLDVEIVSYGLAWDGRPARLVLARDVTREGELARERDAVTRRLQLLLDRMPVACVATDLDLRVTDWNPEAERVFGWAAAEAVGRRPDELFVPPDPRRAVAEVLARADGPAAAVAENRTKDGRAIWCEWRHSPLLDRGEVVGFLGMAADVTDRRAAEVALRAVPRQLLSAQEAERRALARELHDEIGQVLTAVAINLQTVKAVAPPEAGPVVEDSAAVVAEAIRQVRGLSLDLRPPMLDDFGLAAALKWYADQQGRRAGRPIPLTVPPDFPRLPAEVEAGCYRIAQEAVTNALRHAGAARVAITLAADPGGAGGVSLTVADDGPGFDPSGAGDGFGLAGMRERAELLGGRLTVATAPGGGTTVAARIPTRNL